MIPTLITTGTTPKQIARDWYNRRVRLLKDLQRLNAQTPIIELQQQIREIEASLNQLLVLDIDTTEIPSCHLPFDGVMLPLPAGVFLECPLPGLDQISRIESGEYQGEFAHFNPEACAAIRNTLNGAGGTRPNGWLAFQHNRARIRERVEHLIVQGLQQQGRLTILLIGSTFGGFGSATFEPLTQLITEVLEVSSVHDRVMFQRLLLAPGSF